MEPEPVPEIEPEPEAEECANGAVDWPLCSECADGSRPDPDLGCQAPEEECPEGQTRDRKQVNVFLW